jgi:hypothetical protein
MDFGTCRNAWFYRQLPVPEHLFRPALMLVIDRYTLAGAACLLRISIEELQSWRVGRRHPKPSNQAAVLWLSHVPLKAIENLDRVIQAGSPADLDRPVKLPKRTPPVVVDKPDVV